MRRATRGLAASFAVGALLAWAGCSDEPVAPPTPVVPRAKAPVAAEAVAPEAGSYVYLFNPMGRRDPFRSPLGEGVNPAQAGRSLCTDPLCQWDLDQLQLVAVVTGDASPIAMVEDPTGKGYIVRRNSPMGKQEGKVTQILRDSVVVTEFFVAPDGKKSPNPVSLTVRSDVKTSPEMDLMTGRPYSQ
ncbi:MAG TPA: pilus assembly protein PilP [Myxococcaceae bacterium]|nr:pilus assembly protein PilP [Myxococcaceae bacterium]